MKVLNGNGRSYDIRNHEFEDINDDNFLDTIVQDFNPSVIVHLAAVSNRRDTDKNPQLAIETNIIGTYNVLKVASKYNIRVILASSAATSEPESSLYAASKDCMERIAALFNNVIIARFYNVYGPRSKSVVNKFTRNIKAGKPIKLNGNTVRDYIHVDDVIAAILNLIEATKPNIKYDIGTKRSISLKRLVSMIEKIVGKKAKIIQSKPIKEIQRSECLATPTWYKTTLEQGIKKLI